MTKRTTGQVRLADVAREAGVSIGTVSNTLNRPETVSERTRKKVLATIRRLDFVPNQGAATLRSGSSKMLGLVIPDVTNAFYSEIAKGVVEAAEVADYAVVLCDTDDQPERELHHLEMLARHRSAGALIVPRTADDSRLNRLRNVGSHLILIDREAAAHDGCSVFIDDVRGGMLAVAHLCDSGQHRLLLVNGPDQIPQCTNRREGMRRALRQADRDPDDFVEITVEDMSSRGGEHAVDGLVASGELPDGIFCINDQLATGVIRSLMRHGIGIGDQVAVVGYGDSPLAINAPVPLTTVRQPMVELGRAAVGQLLAEVAEPADRHHHSAVVFTPSLVVRDSAP
ncbi:MAG: LacI family DNA-binding transcriptional regulator [Propioniciclava sp.]